MNGMKTIGDIAKEIDVGVCTVRYHLKKSKIKPSLIFRGIKLYDKKTQSKIKGYIIKHVKYICRDFNGKYLPGIDDDDLSHD